jgi:hypothetical protein
MSMKKHANIRIKELIKKYPGVAGVLEEFHLPCKDCGDNNCLVKDITEVENFSLKDEMKFITKMTGAVSDKENLSS